MTTKPLSYGAVINSQVNGQFLLDPATTTGLTFGFKLGRFSNGPTAVSVSAGTVALTDDATNIVQVSKVGTVTAVVSGAESQNVLYKVTTVSGVITAIVDLRSSHL